MTAIIVNDRGEVFTHWASAVSIAENGYETFYSVPQFGKTRTFVIGDADFKPWSMSGTKRQHYTINKPYLFSSVEAAEKSMARMWGGGRLAVVS